MREYEIKKEMLKRKSDCFNQLLDMANKEGETEPESKRICSNGPSQIVFPTSVPVRNSVLDQSDNSTDNDSTRSAPSESRRKQKVTEKITITNSRGERDSVELEYINGNDFDDDDEDDDYIQDKTDIDPDFEKTLPSYQKRSLINDVFVHKSSMNGNADNHASNVSKKGEEGQGDVNSNNSSVGKSPLTSLRKTSRTRRSASERE